MRRAGLLLIATTLSIAAPAAAQLSVTFPAAGAPSSYRTTTISWNPIPGATSYHLEIDDDPNFRSPEVDVSVAGTSYTLSGQRLRLNGQQSWAAYVRINGTRWNASTFTPSYFKDGGESGAWSRLAESRIPCLQSPEPREPYQVERLVARDSPVAGRHVQHLRTASRRRRVRRRACILDGTASRVVGSVLYEFIDRLGPRADSGNGNDDQWVL